MSASWQRIQSEVQGITGQAPSAHVALAWKSSPFSQSSLHYSEHVSGIKVLNEDDKPQSFTGPISKAYTLPDFPPMN
jgi:hypothetical protein